MNIVRKVFSPTIDFGDPMHTKKPRDGRFRSSRDRYTRETDTFVYLRTFEFSCVYICGGLSGGRRASLIFHAALMKIRRGK